ncbi:MAG TPA: hypothetical protein DEB25_03945 [Desulfobulbaceae bacterium]|nr:hypothetical protein [Desulfobulbaceae bacterium]
MHKIVLVVLTALFLCSGISAHGQMTEEAKIEQLINSVEKAPESTKFIRNGREYGNGKAAEHLRTKYKRGKKYAGTAELFIKNIASESSLTGKEYHIRFADGRTVTARQFFIEELKKIEKE